MKVLIELVNVIKNKEWSEISKSIDIDLCNDLNPRKNDLVVLPIEWWWRLIEKIRENTNLGYQEIFTELFGTDAYDSMRDIPTNIGHIKPELIFWNAKYDLSIRSKQTVILCFDRLIHWTDKFGVQH